MSIFVFASRGQHILSFEINALLGFVCILIQNSNFSPAPTTTTTLAPPLHAYSCKVQTRSVWSGKAMWGNAFLPFADTGDFLLETCPILQEHCPEPALGAV